MAASMAWGILPGNRRHLMVAILMILLRLVIICVTMVLAVADVQTGAISYVIVLNVLLDVAYLSFMAKVLSIFGKANKARMQDVTSEVEKSSSATGLAVPLSPKLTLTTSMAHTRNLTVMPPIEKQEDRESKETLVSLAPNVLLVRSLTGKRADWNCIRTIADNIRKPEYTLKQFYDDCIQSFPELSLFVPIVTTLGRRTSAALASSSGTSGEVEYQRTMGALFSVYWILRLDLDGRAGLCYGVDEEWELVEPKKMQNGGAFGGAFDATLDRRAAFLKLMDWDQFSSLVDRAGCGPSENGHHERIVALLCLTTFHDIMKVPALQPIVQPEHAPYHGYEAGVRIIDHDIALSYVLEHYPALLPSNAGLTSEQRRQVLFTQGKMKFNHGWFVQGEAPPGAMLSNFKRVLESGASQMDIDFYFLHWITDLAGAEATPLGGAEKLVLKMPRAVLSSFLWSMPYLSKLATMMETELVERYLCARWRELAGTHTVPCDTDAIVIMRLAIMAQGEPPLNVVEAFRQLPPADQACLVTEMSRTGCEGQTYSRYAVRGGPAFLIYYSPALLQRNNGTVESLRKALHVLTVILRAARAIWPMTKKLEGSTVTLFIGELRADDIDKIVGNTDSDVRSVWVLLHQNDREGAVTLRSAGELNTLYSEGARFRVLDFSKVAHMHATLSSCASEEHGNPSATLHPTGSWGGGLARDLQRFSNSQRLLVFTAMNTDCTKECALLWLVAALNCRTSTTIVELVMTDSQARFQWMEHVFADKFVRGGEWALTDDRNAFVAGNVLVRMYLAHSPTRETTVIDEFLARAPSTPFQFQEKAGRKVALREPTALGGQDYQLVSKGPVACIILSAPIPDVDPKFFERFTACRRTFVVGTPGGINCPMPSWVDLLAALHRVSPVIYLTPELTRSVRFPRNYVLTNPTWPEILRRAVWDATLTCMARRPELTPEIGSWGLILRLNAANASFCRGWYHDIAGASVEDVDQPADLIQAVKSYVDRNSGDDRDVGAVLDELRMLGVSLCLTDLEGGVDKRGQPTTPRAREALRDAYRRELHKSVLVCVMATEMLLFRNPKNQKVGCDDAGFERLQPCCGYADPHRDLSKLYGVDEAIALLMELPIRWLTPAYDVVGMVCGERALEEGVGDVDCGLGLVLHEAGATLGLGMLSEEQRNGSDNPILLTPAQAAVGIYGAGPFN